VIYDLIFGIAWISYHELKALCNRAGFTLKTTSAEWLKMVKDRENNVNTRPTMIKVKVECNDHHITYKRIQWIIDGLECYECAKIKYNSNQ